MEELTSLSGEVKVPTDWYRRWFLLLLILVYASSFVDRIIVAVVGQAIKVEMGLTDLQLGLIGGLAFSIFYTTLGIPLARLAERYNRVTLISLSIIAWSAMTALCGTAGTYSRRAARLPRTLLSRISFLSSVVRLRCPFMRWVRRLA